MKHFSLRSLARAKDIHDVLFGPFSNACIWVGREVGRVQDAPRPWKLLTAREKSRLSLMAAAAAIQRKEIRASTRVALYRLHGRRGLHSCCLRGETHHG